MKFTVAFVTLLSIAAPWSALAKKVDEGKDKREAPPNYSSSGHSSSNYQPSYQSSAQNYQPSSHSHGDASSINVGAGYSIGGAKPSYSYDGQGSAGLQYATQEQPGSGHATYQLAPITLQPHGAGGLVSGDLSQIMSQLTHSLNSGALSLQPSNSVAEFHIGGEGQGAQGQGQELSQPQYNFGKLQQYSLVGALGGSPAHYASGAKGLSSYGSTGPVLFNPSETQSSQSAALAYSVPSTHGQSADEGHSASSGAGGHSLAGLSFGNSGNPFGAQSLKNYGGSHLVASKAPFTPSVYLGSSVQGDSSHGLASAGPVAYNAPSFGGFPGGQTYSFAPAAHGASYPGSFGGFGGDSSKYLAAPSFGAVKGEALGLEGLASFASAGQLGSLSSNNYGFPTSSYPAGASHSAAVARPYYVSAPSKHSHKGSGPSLSSSHSGSKHSYGGHGSSRYSPKDTHGSHSETSYNTIKYSEELKPRIH